MDASALSNAESWLSIISAAKLIAAFLVALGVAIEFGGDWVAKPFEKIIEDARKLELADLHKQSEEAKLETARLSSDSESSRKAIADSNARAAEASQKAAEAELKLEQLRKRMGPRQIESDVFLKALEGKLKSPVEIMFPKEDGEAFQLALQLRDLLRSAKWEASEPVPVPPTDIPRLANQPSHMAAGAQATGVAVVVRADSQQEFDRISDFKADTPMNALRDAIGNTLGGVAGYAAGPDIFRAPPAGTVRIVVGPKP